MASTTGLQDFDPGIRDVLANSKTITPPLLHYSSFHHLMYSTIFTIYIIFNTNDPITQNQTPTTQSKLQLHKKLALWGPLPTISTKVSAWQMNLMIS